MKYHLKDLKGNPELVYMLIRTWELEAGEDFFDYNESIVNDYNLIFWLHGKGYMNTKKLNQILKPRAINSGFFGINHIIAGYDNWSLMPKGETIPLCEFKKTAIMSELISEVNVLLKRLRKGFNEMNVSMEFEDSLRLKFQYEYHITSKYSIEQINNMTEKEKKEVI